MDAETLQYYATQILAFISRDTEVLVDFLVQSGLTPDTLRQNLENPEIQAGIFDFLLSNETLLVEFTESHNLPPEEPLKLRQHLPGAA